LKSSETDKDTKAILRRISKQNVKQFGRALAKKSTSNPLILWAIAINQIENYDNFVEVVVDAAKFCTNFGYDVLEYVILSSLANPFKNRVKEDGTSVALWLTGLSAFYAKLFRRYAYMDVSMAATYIVCQLKASNIYDLIVLRELVTQMTGILVRENLSDYQLSCYTGGDVLKEQAMSLLRGPGTMVGWKKPSARLLKALTENNLAGLLIVLIAQEQGGSLFNLKTQHNSNLKLLGNLFDEVSQTGEDTDVQCHGVLLQYHEFITLNVDAASLEIMLPTFEIMVRDYGVEPSIAFYLWRPILSERIRQHDVDLTIEMQKKKLLQGLAGGIQGTESGDVSSSMPSIVETVPKEKLSPPKPDSFSQKEDVDGNFEAPKSEEYGPATYLV
jgi:THO complex subunit 2